MLNPSLLSIDSTSSLASEFSARGYVTVDNLLDDVFARGMAEHLDKLPEHDWSATFFPDGSGHSATMTCCDTNSEVITIHRERVMRVMDDGKFSYFFCRRDHFIPECMCPECAFKRWIVGEEANRFLLSVTGRKYTAINSMFASRYSSGCFLSPHTDPVHGDVGVVYQLTRDWKPQWGGLLHFMDANGSVVGVREPVFNSITLFEIPEGGQWHFVSQVAAGVTKSRYAMAGWLVV